MAGDGASKTLARMQLNRQADPKRLKAALPYEFQGTDHFTEMVVRKVEKKGAPHCAVVRHNANETSPNFAVTFGHVVVAESCAFFIPNDITASDAVRIEIPYGTHFQFARTKCARPSWPEAAHTEPACLQTASAICT